MNILEFDRTAVERFRFVSHGFDPASGTATLVYAFDDGPLMTETVVIPGAPFALDATRLAAVEAATQLLHLIAGVSYYKAAVPRKIDIECGAIDAQLAAFLDEVYLNGLGEFAYRNGLDLHDRIAFPHASGAVANAAAAGLPERALVAIGGGKDSLVSIEALRDAGVNPVVSWIGGSQLIATCAERTGLPTLNITRQLAPELFEYNRLGAWNGHIPVTAVNSAILVLAAIVTGANQVVFSNERSASYGSLIEGTGEVNHQWSKGWAFEKAFADIVRARIAPDLTYYSLLRPLSELAVARQFARTEKYDAWFSSCNRNFHLLGEKPTQRWCGICPKCHFVFLALAPFMPKTRLVSIFGRNLLDDEGQTQGYDELLEYRNHKPFECVGEARESRAAMAALTQRSEWEEDALVDRFAREIAPQLDPSELSIEPLLVLTGEHGIPAHVWEKVRAHF